MLDFCAAQALRGGYLGNRFRLSTAYQPFLVTTAGAIFLVQGADRDRLRRYLRFGLPSPVIDGKPTDWLTCPYQPENGWGRIHRRGPWRNFEAVEFATLEWVDGFNHRRLLEPIGNIPPAEAEVQYYAKPDAPAMAA